MEITLTIKSKHIANVSYTSKPYSFANALYNIMGRLECASRDLRSQLANAGVIVYGQNDEIDFNLEGTISSVQDELHQIINECFGH